MKRRWCCVRFYRNGFGKVITICWFLLGKIFVSLYRRSAKLALLKINALRLVFPGSGKLLILERKLGYNCWYLILWIIALKTGLV